MSVLGLGDEPLDATFAFVVERAPTSLRALARALPYRLGITHRPHGGWGDFATLGPICDLPLFALDGLSERLAADSVARYRFAHRVGGFHGLLVDRVTDGQAVIDRELRELRVWLRGERVTALAEAIGDDAEAERLVRAGERAFRAGTRIERKARTEQRIDPGDYARAVLLKTHWLAVPTMALIRRYGDTRISASFDRGYGSFMLALQVLDDGLDASEDRVLFGITVPELLGVAPDVLRHTARLVSERAAGELAESGFTEFATWTQARADQLRVGASFLSAVGALALTERLVPSLVRASPRPTRWNPGGPSEALCTS